MKNLISFVLILFITGCSGVPQAALSEANDNSLEMDAFIVMVQQGKTTRDQEQAMLRANRRAWHAQNFALNNVPLPPDMQTPGNTGPLDANLLEALSNDLNIRANMQKLNDTFNKGGIGTINSKTPK